MYGMLFLSETIIAVYIVDTLYRS